MGWFTKKAKLGIVLDTPTIFAGQVVQGRVLAQIFEECKAESLQLTVSGKEYSHVHWTETHGSGDDRRTEHHHAYANRTLVHIDVPLAIFANGIIVPGQYEFPFSAQMPEDLPSPMSAKGDGGDCKICYDMKARLHCPGWTNWDVKAKMPVLVSSAPLPAEASPVFVEPETTQVNFCCCFNRGQMSLGVTFDDTSIARGDAVNVGMACKNESTSEIQGITVAIYENVRWTAQGHSNGSRRVVARSSFDPSFVQGTASLEEKAESSDRSAVYSDLFKQLSAGTQRTPLACYADARDTYSGKIIG